jgi:hypothetical protein
VEFTGFVPEARQVEIMQSAWFAVATSAKEGWGMTSTEANACGTPVVASNVPGLRDSVKDGETGLLYPYGDHEALARAMIGLLGDRARRESLSAQALRWAGTFTWENAARKTATYLQAVAEGLPLPDCSSPRDVRVAGARVRDDCHRSPCVVGVGPAGLWPRRLWPPLEEPSPQWRPHRDAPRLKPTAIACSPSQSTYSVRSNL